MFTMSHERKKSGDTSEQPQITAPLLSEAGREFLAGNLPAEDYIVASRLRAEKEARQETSFSLQPEQFVVAARISFAFLVGYLILAVGSFATGQSAIGIIAILTGIGFGLPIASIYYRRWR